MFPYLILGFAILAGVLLAGRWFTTADPKLLVKVFRWTLLGVIGTVALFFLFTGRMAWAIFALPALLPWLMRARAAHRMFKTFSRMTSGWGGRAAGQSSDVETRFLRMVLDHDSGRMSGEVIDGDYAGRTLAGMSLDELLNLLKTCWVEDQPSAQVLVPLHVPNPLVTSHGSSPRPSSVCPSQLLSTPSHTSMPGASSLHSTSA